MEKKESKLVALGGLWKNKNESGFPLTGMINSGLRLVVFKNDRKKNEKEPDYRVYLENPTYKKEVNSETTTT